MFATRRIQALRYICVPQAEAGAYWNLVEVTFEQPGTGADSAVLFAVPNPGQVASFDMPVLPTACASDARALLRALDAANVSVMDPVYALPQVSADYSQLSRSPQFTAAFYNNATTLAAIETRYAQGFAFALVPAPPGADSIVSGWTSRMPQPTIALAAPGSPNVRSVTIGAIGIDGLRWVDGQPLEATTCIDIADLPRWIASLQGCRQAVRQAVRLTQIRLSQLPRTLIVGNACRPTHEAGLAVGLTTGRAAGLAGRIDRTCRLM